MLTIRNLTKTFSKKTAVDNLSLTIRPGEIYGFIGHNGAGKTTTIKAVCGILRFDAGEIEIDGISVKAQPVLAKQRLAYLPDNPDLYEFLSGIKYLNFIADIFGLTQAQREERIKSLADAYELTPDLGQPISAYSHGMKQKLAVIGALIHEPRLLVLDEPFTGLDPKASFLLKQQMKQLCAQSGAVFFSTHVLDVAEKLCDRVGILRQGRLVAEGSVEEVKGKESLEEVFLELEGERHA